MSDQIHAIVMPKWGLSMEEGTVVAWLADEGSLVEAGADLIEIETTKINNVVENPVGGSLRRQVVGQGQTVGVGTLLAVVADASVDDVEIDRFVAGYEVVVPEAEQGDASAEPQTVEAGGCVLSYVTAGGGDGPPVVFVHGFGGDSSNWLFNQPALAQNHETYALDLPGHGRSSKQIVEGDVPWLTGVVVSFLDQLELEKVHLVGHSLGAAVCLNSAINEPGRAASVTLLCPAGLGKQINIDYINGFISADRRKQMKSVLATLFADEKLVNREMVEQLLKYKRLDGVTAALNRIAAGVFKDGRQALVLAGRLSELEQRTVPVQIIWGRQDQVLTPVDAGELPAGVAYHVLDDAGHMVHLERSAQVNELIGALVDSCGA